MKKTTAALLGVAGTAAAIATVPYLHRQNTDLEASHYIFRSHKIGGALEGFRITQISDLHNRKFGTGNLRLLALTEAQLPDLLVITGDLTDSYRPNLQQALDTAARLAKIAPCYFVTGNHELRMEQQELEDFLRALEGVGVTPLRGEAVTLGLGLGFRLLGVDANRASGEHLKRLMKNRPPEELNILLSHKPHYAKSYEKSGVDLVLTGHAHGGQWRLPGVGGLYAPGQGPLPRYTAGMYRLGNTVMCVSRGLANFPLLPRVENKPEIVTVILRGEKK
ncbi:MAG: metallophosphoesterase [Oscillospiraceae bacterium]|nr:metallophosphoesterase [Oscillospiraceae bacterium]